MSVFKVFQSFVQTRDIFICDFVVQVCEDDLYQLCVDPITS
jgi:hypothetical protein